MKKIGENKMKLKCCTVCADVWALNTFHHDVLHFGALTFNELGAVLLLPLTRYLVSTEYFVKFIKYSITSIASKNYSVEVFSR